MVDFNISNLSIARGHKGVLGETTDNPKVNTPRSAEYFGVNRRKVVHPDEIKEVLKNQTAFLLKTILISQINRTLQSSISTGRLTFEKGLYQG